MPVAEVELSSLEQAKMNKAKSISSFFIIIGFTTKVIIFFRGLEISELKEEHLPMDC